MVASCMHELLPGCWQGKSLWLLLIFQMGRTVISKAALSPALVQSFVIFYERTRRLTLTLTLVKPLPKSICEALLIHSN